VDYTKGIHSKIPKSLFKTIPNNYWYQPARVTAAH